MLISYAKLSVHGLATSLSANHRRAAIYWFLIFMVASLVYLYQFHFLVKQYYRKDTITEPEFHYGQLPFPAVTLCNLNAVKTSEMARVPELAALNLAAEELMNTSTLNSGRQPMKREARSILDSNQESASMPRRTRSTDGHTSLDIEVEYECENEDEAAAEEIMFQCASDPTYFDPEKMIYCTDHCPVPQTHPGHSYNPPVTLITPGDTIQHSCEPGYVMMGESNQTCGSDNKYGTLVTECYKLENGSTPCDPDYPTFCGDEGQCFLKNGMEYCICNRGFNGVRCEFVVDNCQSMPCHYMASCISQREGFECKCASGFTGKTCFNDVNECESDPCPEDTNCSDFVNGFKCVPKNMVVRSKNILMKMLNLSMEMNSAIEPESLFTHLQDATAYLVHNLTSDMRRLLGHGFKQTVLDCIYAKARDCHWLEVQHNRFGICHTFNGFRENQTKSLIHGKEYGLKIVLDAAPEEYSNFVSTVGFKISFNAPDVHPFLEFEGLNVVPDYLNIFILNYKQINLMLPPYGNCALGSLDVPYLFPGNYSVFGCQLSMKQIQIGNKCNCFSPMYATQNSSTAVCPLEKKECIDEAEVQETNFQAHCKPPCKREFYSVFSMKATKFSDPKTIKRSNKKGLTEVHVYYNTLLSVYLVERVSYTKLDLVSDFGGLLGLAIGISVISFVEFIVLLPALAKRMKKFCDRSNG